MKRDLELSVFDIIGPVMIGPSSSHTAGAVRLGNLARSILGHKPRKAAIGLHGSFRDTGKGHGTDRALVAGLLGFPPDDTRIPKAFELTEGMEVEFSILNWIRLPIPTPLFFGWKAIRKRFL